VTTTAAMRFRFEPTVFGAVHRYRIMVLAIALMTAAAVVGYTLLVPSMYRASAVLTVPQPLMLREPVDQGSEQYLDSQMILLQSQDVAQRAVLIANAALGSNRLAAQDFSGEYKSLEIIPPDKATPGTYGAATITMSFTWPSARIAMVGANAVAQAFDEARSAAIRAQGDAIVASLDKLMAYEPRARDQLSALVDRRSRTLVNQEVDLAHHPTIGWAVEPQVPINGNLKNAGAIGLLIGTLLGAALAFARASRRSGFDNRLDPAALYDVPLLGEIPALKKMAKKRSNGSAAACLLPMTADPHSAVAEAFRLATGSLERIRAARDPRLSLVFVSPLAGADRSTVVANVALAIAEGGTRVLAVDADAAGDLTALLLPDSPTVDGFEQVLAGQRALVDCVQPSPWNEAVAVLGSGPTTPERVTGAAYSKAVDNLLAEAKATFDVILIDSPALLRVADAAELVDVADAAIIVVSPHELIRDHLEMATRLDLIESEAIGYIYERAPMRSHRAQYWRAGVAVRPARPTGARVVPPSSAFEAAQSLNGDSGSSSLPHAGR
jgi:Mrp family chromosome partitioning ATPase